LDGEGVLPKTLYFCKHDYFLMDHHFEIIVSYNNKKLTFNGLLLTYGYNYRIEVEINGTKVLFESDEERNWRAIISYEEIEKDKKVSKELLSIIASEIDKILK